MYLQPDQPCRPEAEIKSRSQIPAGQSCQAEVQLCLQAAVKQESKLRLQENCQMVVRQTCRPEAEIIPRSQIALQTCQQEVEIQTQPLMLHMKQCLWIRFA